MELPGSATHAQTEPKATAGGLVKTPTRRASPTPRADGGDQRRIAYYSFGG
jgi:hypothetical protein